MLSLSFAFTVQVVQSFGLEFFRTAIAQLVIGGKVPLNTFVKELMKRNKDYKEDTPLALDDVCSFVRESILESLKKFTSAISDINHCSGKLYVFVTSESQLPAPLQVRNVTSSFFYSAPPSRSFRAPRLFRVPSFYRPLFGALLHVQALYAIQHYQRHELYVDHGFLNDAGIKPISTDDYIRLEGTWPDFFRRTNASAMEILCGHWFKHYKGKGLDGRPVEV